MKQSHMAFLVFLTLMVSLVTAAPLIRLAPKHAGYYGYAKLQRFHSGDVPRLGGVNVFLGLAVGWAYAALSVNWSSTLNLQVSWASVWPWFLVALPALAAGVYEDVTQRMSVRTRLALTAVSALLACWLLDVSISRLGVPMLDNWLAGWPWIGVALAFLAVCGMPHSFNIIDGYNGLAAIVAIMACLAIAYVALMMGDRELAAMVICLAGATAGFLFWNYPRGLLFAGDGGAYLWGVVVALASILLVQRHSQVSPWFPMLLLIYPVWETVFSIYRKLARGGSPGVADTLHFHQLIYRRIVRGVFHDDAARRMLMRNNKTSPYLWGFTLLTVAPAVLFWNNTPVLMLFCAMFVASYLGGYFMIVRFKVPHWLRR